MYSKDPRDRWTPAMSHYFHVFPDDSMFDLTPARLDALVASVDATVSAGQQGSGTTTPKRRVRQ
jgi:hypothetical protein